MAEEKKRGKGGAAGIMGTETETGDGQRVLAMDHNCIPTSPGNLRTQTRHNTARAWQPKRSSAHTVSLIDHALVPPPLQRRLELEIFIVLCYLQLEYPPHTVRPLSGKHILYGGPTFTRIVSDLLLINPTFRVFHLPSWTLLMHTKEPAGLPQGKGRLGGRVCKSIWSLHLLFGGHMLLNVVLRLFDAHIHTYTLLLCYLHLPSMLSVSSTQDDNGHCHTPNLYTRSCIMGTPED